MILPNPTIDQADKFSALRIGLLGGSFNPAHKGHLEMSLYALEHLRLDLIWWLVSPQNPLKPTTDMAPLADRLQGARALLGPEKRIQATDIETQMGTRFTADTLAALQHNFASTRFLWLMGADNMAQIEQWHDWERLFRLVPVAVFRRSGYDEHACNKDGSFAFAKEQISGTEAPFLIEKKPPVWLILENQINLLSATFIREAKRTVSSS